MAGLAAAALGERGGVPWLALVEDYDRIRDADRARDPGLRGLRPPRARAGRLRAAERGARAALRDAARAARCSACTRCPRTRSRRAASGSRRIRSHDQFNTTVYGFDDRLRGLRGDRRVVLLHADDIAAAGLRGGAGGRSDQSLPRRDAHAARLSRAGLRPAAALRGRLLPGGQRRSSRSRARPSAATRRATNPSRFRSLPRKTSRDARCCSGSARSARKHHRGLVDLPAREDPLRGVGIARGDRPRALEVRPPRARSGCRPARRRVRAAGRRSGCAPRAASGSSPARCAGPVLRAQLDAARSIVSDPDEGAHLRPPPAGISGRRRPDPDPGAACGRRRRRCTGR